MTDPQDVQHTPETEGRNTDTLGIDLMAPTDMARALVGSHAGVVEAAAGQAEAIGRAAVNIARVLRQGGRIIYAGAGTSGRLAETDASELLATFGWPPVRTHVMRAGASTDPLRSEDSVEYALAQVADVGFGPQDALIAVAASGTTVFTRQVAQAAASAGAHTVAIVCARDTPLADVCADPIEVIVGAEPIAGSTRMKAGLAQKLVLTSLSTQVMVLLGRTYDNLMVEVPPTLAKLRRRHVRIVSEACGVGMDAAGALLAANDGSVKAAIVMHLGGVDAARAAAVLAHEDGAVRRALARLRGEPS